jgi:hypothetical protein
MNVLLVVLFVTVAVVILIVVHGIVEEKKEDKQGGMPDKNRIVLGAMLILMGILGFVAIRNPIRWPALILPLLAGAYVVASVKWPEIRPKSTTAVGIAAAGIAVLVAGAAGGSKIKEHREAGRQAERQAERVREAERIREAERQAEREAERMREAEREAERMREAELLNKARPHLSEDFTSVAKYTDLMVLLEKYRQHLNQQLNMDIKLPDIYRIWITITLEKGKGLDVLLSNLPTVLSLQEDKGMSEKASEIMSVLTPEKIHTMLSQIKEFTGMDKLLLDIQPWADLYLYYRGLKQFKNDQKDVKQKVKSTTMKYIGETYTDTDTQNHINWSVLKACMNKSIETFKEKFLEEMLTIRNNHKLHNSADVKEALKGIIDTPFYKPSGERGSTFRDFDFATFFMDLHRSTIQFTKTVSEPYPQLNVQDAPSKKVICDLIEFVLCFYLETNVEYKQSMLFSVNYVYSNYETYKEQFKQFKDVWLLWEGFNPHAVQDRLVTNIALQSTLTTQTEKDIVNSQLWPIFNFITKAWKYSPVFIQLANMDRDTTPPSSLLQLMNAALINLIWDNNAASDMYGLKDIDRNLDNVMVIFNEMKRIVTSTKFQEKYNAGNYPRSYDEFKTDVLDKISSLTQTAYYTPFEMNTGDFDHNLDLYTYFTQSPAEATTATTAEATPTGPTTAEATTAEATTAEATPTGPTTAEATTAEATTAEATPTGPTTAEATPTGPTPAEATDESMRYKSMRTVIESTLERNPQPFYEIPRLFQLYALEEAPFEKGKQVLRQWIEGLPFKEGVDKSLAMQALACHKRINQNHLPTILAMTRIINRWETTEPDWIQNLKVFTQSVRFRKP